MTKAHILEKDVKKGVKMILTKHDWFWWMPPSNAFGRTGISDFHALKAHVFMAIETKVGKKEPTPMQKGFLISIQSEGGIAFVVNEDRLPTLDMFLTAFGNSVELSRAGQPEDPDTAALMLNCMRQLQWEVA
jgi:hypothetical protein